MINLECNHSIGNYKISSQTSKAKGRYLKRLRAYATFHYGIPNTFLRDLSLRNYTIGRS